jgi:hypothetical protein
MSAHINEDAQNHVSQMFTAGDKDRQSLAARFFQDFLSAVRQARNLRRRRLAARRAGAMNPHLRRDLGIEASPVRWPIMTCRRITGP